MSELITRFTNFEKLISTGLIKFLYWIGLIGIALFTLFGMFSGFSIGFMAGLGTMIMSVVFAIFSIVMWRVMCEIYIVIFGMYDRLGNIQQAVGGGAAKDIDSVSDTNTPV